MTTPVQMDTSIASLPTGTSSPEVGANEMSSLVNMSSTDLDAEKYNESIYESGSEIKIKSGSVTFNTPAAVNASDNNNSDSTGIASVAGSGIAGDDTSAALPPVTAVSSGTSTNSNVQGTTNTPIASSPAISTTTTAPISSRLRVYRATTTDKWVTRDIAALDFLLGIPLESEQKLVYSGWLQQQSRHSEKVASDDDDDISDKTGSKHHSDQSSTWGGDVAGATLGNSTSGYGVSGGGGGAIGGGAGRWWEKWVKKEALHQKRLQNKIKTSTSISETELELPDVRNTTATATAKGLTIGNLPHELQRQIIPIYAPARRLEGDEAVKVQIPLKDDTVTRQRSIARQAAIREWELKVAHGLGVSSVSGSANDRPHGPMLDGRLFFSASGSYPMGVFSLIRYEPKREEAALRRQKLEARGGGGSHFVMPTRDWRGISYRSLLPHRGKKINKNFNRFLKQDSSPKLTYASADSDDTSISVSSSSSDTSDDDDYVPGMLDDPNMVLGRHRNVMIGDRTTGCIVSSTIQFVKPALLKAELNKQFRDRFDGWEPPKSQRKYIGARVVDGVYTLMDPADDVEDRPATNRKRQGSVSSVNSTGAEPKDSTIRMPPSLTLSKIRSIKHQALLAAVKAKLEVGTVALACVYFERLCLNCRVDKSNRRLCFASCLLLASKINEPNEVLVIRENKNSDNDGKKTRLQSLIRPNKRSSSMFASLLEFFTEGWNLSLRHLFAAEWGVFAALNFELHCKASQVAFHFKRLMKTLEWKQLTYLGTEMYRQWQDVLDDEDNRIKERAKRNEMRRRLKEERIQRDLLDNAEKVAAAMGFNSNNTSNRASHHHQQQQEQQQQKKRHQNQFDNIIRKKKNSYGVKSGDGRTAKITLGPKAKARHAAVLSTFPSTTDEENDATTTIATTNNVATSKFSPKAYASLPPSVEGREAVDLGDGLEGWNSLKLIGRTSPQKEQEQRLLKKGLLHRFVGIRGDNKPGAANAAVAAGTPTSGATISDPLLAAAIAKRTPTTASLAESFLPSPPPIFGIIRKSRSSDKLSSAARSEYLPSRQQNRPPRLFDLPFSPSMPAIANSAYALEESAGAEDETGARVSTGVDYNEESAVGIDIHQISGEESDDNSLLDAGAAGSSRVGGSGSDEGEDDIIGIII